MIILRDTLYEDLIFLNVEKKYYLVQNNFNRTNNQKEDRINEFFFNEQDVQMIRNYVEHIFET